MIFYLIGVNYKYVPYILQEKIYRERQRIADFWNNRAPLQTAILRTCNRLEVYTVANNSGEYLKDIVAFKEAFGLFFANGYIKVGKKDVFLHGLRLATGLDSELKGELQILEQIKAWLGQGSFSQILNDFWQEITPLAEDIRQEAGLDKEEYNIASIVFDDLLKRSKRGYRQKIIVAGTGKVAELFADFKPPDTSLYFAAHKNYEKACYLAIKAKGAAVSLEDIKNILEDADALVSATSSPHIVFKKNELDRVVFGRRKPLYIYDLAMPHDVEPEVAKLKGVVLRSLNNSDELFRGHTEKINRNIQLAEYLVAKIIEEHREAFANYDFKNRDEAEQIGYQAS